MKYTTKSHHRAHRSGRTGRTKKIVHLMIAALAVFAVGTATAYLHNRSSYAASGVCATPTTDNGTDTLSINVPADATYTMWTRMMAPDTTNNAINVQIDSASCYNVGGSTAMTPNTWTWVNYADGTTSKPISLTLTAGAHTFKYIGTKAGVSVDRIILASDSSCTPTGTGDACATGDATPPTVAMTAPAANASLTGTSTLTATATDTSGISKVDFQVDGTTVGTSNSNASPYSYSWNSATIANGTHSINAVATDKAGNVGTSARVTVTVNNQLACTGTPSVPSGLTSSAVTYTAVTLNWTASTATQGCVLSGYNIYRNGTKVGSAPTGTTYQDTNLSLKTAYSYTVTATDSTGHESAQSTPLSVTTQADTTAPTKPSGLTAPAITSNAISLTWTASSDDVAVAGYYIYRNGTQVGQSATASYSDSGLTPSTAYKYTVKAFDASGNVSAASDEVSFTTLASGSGGGNTCDLNNDGKINIFDLNILLTNWNETNAKAADGDCNGDGTINVFDLNILLTNWS